MAIWKRRTYQPEQLVQEIKRCRASGRQGDPFFDREMRTLLVSMIKFDQTIPDAERVSIAAKALRQVWHDSEVTENTLLKHICILEHQFLNQPTAPYVLATGLSVSNATPLPRKSVDGAMITFTSSLPAAFRRQREQLNQPAEHLRIPPSPTGYQAVRVHVHARTVAEASQLALEKIDLLRAIWNLHLHYGKPRVTFVGRDQPVNQILLGPLHSLHHPSGKLATDMFWYEPGYRFPPRALRLVDKLDKLFAFETQVRNRLKHLNYGTTTKQALLRYVRALDEHDWQKSFSRLWSLLELLTHTQYAKYDVTIQRACFLFEEHAYFRQVLEHLRENRNRSTHDDEGNDEIEALMYQSKNIVDALLVRQIFNRLKFNSMAEWGEFLDMSVDPNLLNAKLDSLNNEITKLKRTTTIVQKALQFRHASGDSKEVS